MKKLTPTTEFVIQQKETSTLDKVQIDWYDSEVNILYKIRRYAEFLRQPLTLGMFVHVSPDGNVLEEPERWKDYLSAPESFDGNVEWYDFYEYEKAKGKVIFEGFELFDAEWHKGTSTVHNPTIGITIHLQSGTISIQQSTGVGFGTVKTVEDLCQYELELTESAIKQIGL